MASIHITFDVIRDSETVKGKCRVCGKPCQETASAENTVSPFNVDPLTRVQRTERQVRQVVRGIAQTRAEKLRPDGIRCKACRDRQSTCCKCGSRWRITLVGDNGYCTTCLRYEADDVRAEQEAAGVDL